MSETILVIDDEKPIAEIIRYNLEKEGFRTLVAYNGEEAIKVALLEKPDLILLDIMLPRLDGFTVCQQVRKKQNVPIIMLTAKEDESDKVLGLELGADDYITKPFGMRELVARIKAMLRRVQIQNKISEYVTCGELTIDLDKMEFKKGNKIIKLTHREFTLMSFLMKNAGFVFTREQLLGEVWGSDFFGDDRTVDVTIRRLREKIEDEPRNPFYLCTKRGTGYFLRGHS